MDKLKTITSYAGHARWMAEATDYGYIPRRKQSEIRTPYSSGPTHVVYLWKNQPVIVCETSHKRYEVFAVPDGETIYHTDTEATDVFVEARRACAWMP